MPVQFGKLCADNFTIIVDRGHTLHITAVGYLIALGIEAIAGAAARNRLLGAAQIVHPLKGAGNTLAHGIQADLAIHVDVQPILRLTDGGAQRGLFIQQIQQKLGNACNLLVILRFRHGKNRFVLRFGHNLVAQVGVLDFCDIGVTVKNALRFIHKGLKLVLIAECFFQIHVYHLCYKNPLLFPL